MFKKRTPVLPTTGVTKSGPDSPNVVIKPKCKNCLKYFDPEQNEKCWFHSGKAVTDGLRVYNQYDEVKYSCCGAIQQGYNPIYKEAQGCQYNDKHIFGPRPRGGGKRFGPRPR